MRMTPWESCPRRFARTSSDAINRASPGGTRRAVKISSAVRSNVFASMVGMIGRLPVEHLDYPNRRANALRAPQARSANDLVGSQQQRRWDRQSEGGGGLRIDDA